MNDLSVIAQTVPASVAGQLEFSRRALPGFAFDFAHAHHD
jgi:hypothetical protein